MRNRPTHSRQPAPAVVLMTWLIVFASACAAPSPSPTSVAEPTMPPTDPPTTEREAIAAPPPTDVPPTDIPPTLVPTDPPPTATAPPPTEPPPTSANYELVFETTWSADSHPADFPPDPHFSPLIGASHGPDARLWEVGSPASPGIKNMAETGGTSPLDSEIEAFIAGGTACATISGGGVPVSPGTVSVRFTVNLDCPLVSVVTMIAPSPDWFVGVAGLNLLEDGAWVDELTVELLPYDAGTDSGTRYTSPNDSTSSPEPITLIEGEPLVVDSIVAALGTFTFTRLDD